MATSTLVTTITTTEDLGTQATRWDIAAGKNPFRVLNGLINFIGRVATGSAVNTTVDVQLNGGNAVAASGTITMATSSGTVGAIINGVTITVTWATSDTASSTALAAAINGSANALIAGIVTANANAGVTTITAVTKGIVGNSITLAATGTNVTASGARLTAGAAAAANSITF